MSRAEFKSALLSAFPMDAPANQGGTIVLGSNGDISTTNPLLASDGTSLNLLGQVFELLVGASPIDGRPVPGLADSWTVSDDELTYTFKLNPDARWHDGVDVTADDVAFSFDAVLDPNLNSPYRSQVREVVKSYRVVDPDTFEITATDRFVTFLYSAPAAVFIMPKHIWESVPVEQWSFDGGSTGEDLSRVVGTGPFLFKAWEQGQRVTLAKNPNHYDTVPNIDEFVMVVQPETDTLVRSLESGDIDLLEILPAPDTAKIQGTPGLKVAIYDIYQITYYIMNLDGQRAPALSDQRVRQAMYQAIDRQSITDNIFLGFGEPAVGTQPPPSPSYDPAQMQPPYAYDPNAAKQLLADAGWTDTNNNKIVDKDGKDLKLTISYTGGDATVESAAAYLQEAWKQIGIDVELQNINFELVEQQLFEGDFDMSLLAFGLSPDGSQGYLFTCDAQTSGFNLGSYCNPEYDALDAQQLREFDPAKRIQLQIQLSQIIWSDLPIGPIRFGVARTGYSAHMHNFFPNGYGFLWSLPFVWVDSGS
jgi:peptide/nickel transport system substrate-binding protein